MKVKYCPQCSQLLETQEREGNSRLCCPDSDCGFVHWNNPTPVVAAIIEYRGQIVLVRNHDWPDKVLGLVSGFLEAFEDPEKAIIREVEEELGLVAVSPELIGVYPFQTMNQVLIVYFTHCEGSIRLGEELAAYKLLDREKVKPWDFGTGLAMRDWLARFDKA